MASEEGVPSLQLVSGTGEFNLQGMDEFAKSVSVYEKGLSYAIVAIMGPQSSGKSTLLNSLFKTRFRMMDFLKGRGQTTQGIWMAPANADLATFTLVLDLEGTDGRERGEDDTAFEKQSTLFALAVADVIIVNMWCHDIGREHAANKPLLKTVFQVMMRLFLPRKATLLFVVRDKTKTPMESLEPILREDLERIWSAVPKPEEHKDTKISDFFNVEVTWLPNFEEKEELFLERVNMLRDRFQSSIAPGEIAGDRRGVVPAQALPLSMQGIWERIRLNKDLDLPAHKVMVATVRCEQIADEKLQLLQASQEWAALKAQVESKAPDLSGFGPQLNSLVGSSITSYEQEAAFFEERVRESKKQQLLGRLKETVGPVHAAAVGLLSSRALDAFQQALDQATGGQDGSAAAFAASSRECSSRAISQFQESLTGMDVPALGLEVQSEAARFQQRVEKAVADLREQKLKDIQKNAAEYLLAEFLPPVSTILEKGRPDAWHRISALWWAELGRCQADVGAALLGFELTEEEREKVLGAVEEEGLTALQARTRDLAKGALQLMKERFTTVFMHDSDGMPRRWTSSVDVPRLLHDARSASLGVLAAVAAVQLEERSPAPAQGGAAAAKREALVGNSILASLTPLLEEKDEEAALATALAAAEAGPQAEGEVGAARGAKLLSKSFDRRSLRLWENVDPSLTFLSPEDCRGLWKQLKKETMFQLQQALQAQEASQSSSWLPPPWAIIAIVALGWNEFMSVLRNPLLALLLAALWFFGRAVWAQVAGEDIFRHGMVPGLLALSSRVVPAVLRVFQQLVEAAQGQMDNMNAPHHPQNQFAGYAAPEASSSVASSSHMNGIGAHASSTLQTAGQELRHRPGATNSDLKDH